MRTREDFRKSSLMLDKTKGNWAYLCKSTGYKVQGIVVGMFV